MNEDTFFLGAKALILNNHEHVLVLKTNKGAWDLPGGRMVRGEQIEQTLKREIFEETGLAKLDDACYIGTVLSKIRIPIGTSDAGLILSFYHCRLTSAPTINLSNEHISFEWLELEPALQIFEEKYSTQFLQMTKSFYSALSRKMFDLEDKPDNLMHL